MTLGIRHRERQMEAFAVASDLPESPGPPFYTALNRFLAANAFDTFVERLCARYYSETAVSTHSGQGWKDYTKTLARKAGLDDPTDDELWQFNCTRTAKKVSNDDWEKPYASDAKITRIKDGTPRIAYNAEHAVDLRDLGLNPPITLKRIWVAATPPGVNVAMLWFHRTVNARQAARRQTR